jgi:hypothetical protein
MMLPRRIRTDFEPPTVDDDRAVLHPLPALR